MAKTKERIAVMVTTDNTKRGVFFGYVPGGADLSADPLRLEDARMCIYWSASVKGVLGLASTGPDSACRIGPRVPGFLVKGITAVAEVTEQAAKAWETAPWS